MKQNAAIRWAQPFPPTCRAHGLQLLIRECPNAQLPIGDERFLRHAFLRVALIKHEHGGMHLVLQLKEKLGLC